PGTADRVVHGGTHAAGRRPLRLPTPSPSRQVHAVRPLVGRADGAGAGNSRPGGGGCRFMRWWVDIANAPHVTLFGPVADELERRGDEVFVTTWDRGQTLELAKSRWPDAIAVGTGGFRRPLVDKAAAIW